MKAVGVGHSSAIARAVQMILLALVYVSLISPRLLRRRSGAGTFASTSLKPFRRKGRSTASGGAGKLKLPLMRVPVAGAGAAPTATVVRKYDVVPSSSSAAQESVLRQRESASQTLGPTPLPSPSVVNAASGKQELAKVRSAPAVARESRAQTARVPRTDLKG